MRKEEFIAMVENMEPYSSSKRFDIVVSDKVTQSERVETYKVIVYATRAHKEFGHPLYKLQWEENGKPRLPKLKDNIKKTLIAATNNTTTFLTSGFAVYVTNDEGMKSAEEVWRLLNLLAENGIVARLLEFH